MCITFLEVAFMKIISFSPFGYEGELVTVEVDLRRGIPAVDLVGLADSAVKEARDRMRVAIRNSNFDFPQERVLISLSPADVKKEGSGFDLAIALGVLQEQDKIRTNSKITPQNEQNLLSCEEKILIMGELELSGKIRKVRGVNAAVATAAENGVKFCIVPEENKDEALGLEIMQVFGVNNLAQAFDLLKKIPNLKDFDKKTNNKFPNILSNNVVDFAPIVPENDMSEIVGQNALVRALQIAASGFHNIIAYGPPGCGKSLAMQRYESLVPYLTKEESYPVTRIYSLAGIMKPGEPLIKQAPFRIPHQSASLQGMIGGGINCNPGEITLAHNGALFLDEAAEFRTSVLQALRVPLENGCVTLSRAGRHTVYPAQFQLLVATNPCPCGNFGSKEKICVCSGKSIDQYWKKFSAPLLDRIDLRIPVSAVKISANNKKNNTKTLTSNDLREEIARAVATQRARQGKRNALLSPEEINYFCNISEDCRHLLNQQSNLNGFSARAIHSCIKIARTIADMAGSFTIREEDLQEAIELRKNEGGIDIMF